VNHAFSPQSSREELANALTHGVGAALAVAGLAVLVTLAALHGDAWRVVSFALYGVTLVLLYVFSTLYHALPWPRAKAVFHRLDHVAIFLLIAGTYTPLSLVTLRGAWGWSMFGVEWALACVGILVKTVFFGRFRGLGVAAYVGMGWVALIAIEPLVTSVPLGGLLWILAGGLAYTGGVAFYVWKTLSYHHAIWHLFVLAGSACHWVCMLLYVLPMPGAI
jgi:hemolysin III